MHKVIYKIFLEATAAIALLAGLSFCAELVLPGVISLSQKTFALLTLVVIMVIVARQLSLAYPQNTISDHVVRKQQRGILLLIGAVSTPPLYIATQNFSPMVQVAIIILTLTIGLLVIKETQKNSVY